MQGELLVIEDDQACRELIRSSLGHYVVHAAENLREAKVHLHEKRSRLDGILLDIHLPDGDGLRLLFELSRNDDFKNVPCLILSADHDISGKVMAFSQGADDFIQKPFDPIELKARVDARVQKSKSTLADQSQLKLADLLIDFQKQKAFLCHREGALMDLELTLKELKILTLLCKRLETVFTRDKILLHVWEGLSISDRTVDSHIAHLRKKISKTGIEIETFKGMGYFAQAKPHF